MTPEELTQIEPGLWELPNGRRLCLVDHIRVEVVSDVRLTREEQNSAAAALAPPGYLPSRHTYFDTGETLRVDGRWYCAVGLERPITMSEEAAEVLRNSAYEEMLKPLPQQPSDGVPPLPPEFHGAVEALRGLVELANDLTLPLRLRALLETRGRVFGGSYPTREGPDKNVEEGKKAYSALAWIDREINEVVATRPPVDWTSVGGSVLTFFASRLSRARDLDDAADDGEAGEDRDGDRAERRPS